MIKFSDLDKIKSNYIWHNKFILYSFFILLLINILYLFFNFWIYLGVEDFVPLSYNIYFGVTSFGSASKLIYYSYYSLIIFVVNFILAYIIYKKNRTLAYIIIFTSYFFTFFCIFFSVLINLFIRS
ncbi:hypothetical protein K9M42_02040 [Patescibacteria group bacterium]|nr:hypothetical protein [Patescibacteria group bacterium]